MLYSLPPSCLGGPTPVFLIAIHLARAADGASIDAELVRPTFAAASIPGFDAPRVVKGGVVRAGLLTQFERDPLVRYEFDERVGAVVRDRLNTVLGVSVDFNSFLAGRLTIPVVGQWGSETDALSGDGFGVGDIGAGVRVEVLESGPITLAGRADFALPTGAAGSWYAEEGVRVSPGLVAGFDVGRLGLLADVGVTLRPPVTTSDTLEVGTQLATNLGATFEVAPDTVDAYLGALGRFGFVEGVGAGGSALELLAGAQVHALPVLDVDVAVGRGLLRGYGGSAFRFVAAATFHVAPKEEEKAEPVRRYIVPDPPAEDLLDTTSIEEPEPEPEKAAPVALARIEQTQIVIRDPIQFQVNTEAVLPQSTPTLEFVARLMNENPDITQLIIEGHSSGEGDYGYNYELSLTRALAVFQALVEAGVHPSRLAVRGWGEVSPAVSGSGDAALAANRRVMFHIAHRLAPGEPNPGWPVKLQLPWNGEARTLPPPPAIEPPPPDPARPPPKPNDDKFNPNDFDEDEQ